MGCKGIKRKSKPRKELMKSLQISQIYSLYFNSISFCEYCYNILQNLFVIIFQYFNVKKHYHRKYDNLFLILPD